MAISDYAAWYGALVATLVLLWDVIKWRTEGPRIMAEAKAGWRTIDLMGAGTDVTTVKATNVGSRPTTLTSFGMYWIPPDVSIRDRKKWRAFIIKPSIEQPNRVPDKLEPGDVWHGLVNEKGEYLDLQRQGGRFLVALGFSHTAKEMLVPVTRSGALPPAK